MACLLHIACLPLNSHGQDENLLVTKEIRCLSLPFELTKGSLRIGHEQAHGPQSYFSFTVLSILNILSILVKCFFSPFGLAVLSQGRQRSNMRS